MIMSPNERPRKEAGWEESEINEKEPRGVEAPARVKSKELNVVDGARLLRPFCQVPRKQDYRNVAISCEG
jgi:hypothetical protein